MLYLNEVEKLNKRNLLIMSTLILCIVVLFCLNEIKSFDGYYRTIDSVVKHQKEVQKGAEEIALIKNGSGYVKIMRLDDSIIFYSFKSKNTLTGKKYAIAHTATKTIDYDTVPESFPDIRDWNIFAKTIFNESDEKDLYWYIVGVSNGLTIENNVNKYEYSYNGKHYYLLCSLLLD